MLLIDFDTSFANGTTGIGRDARQTLKALRQISNLRTVNDGFLSKSTIARKVINIVSIFFPNFFRLSSKYDGILFQHHLGYLRPGSNTLFWIIRLHDIFPITNPEWFTTWSTLQFKIKLKRAIKGNAFFIFSSETTRRIFNERFPQCLDRTFVIPCVAVNFVSSEACNKCLGCEYTSSEFLEYDYVLSVGTIEPRKNYSRLLDFWQSQAELLPNELNLLIVGKPGWKNRQVERRLSNLSLSPESRIRWIKDSCDKSLATMMQSCKAFLSISLNEGFNLPAIEARVIFEKPIILSDIEVHREIHGESALYFENNAQLFELLTKERNSGNIQKLSEERYTEKQMAKDFISILNELNQNLKRKNVD